MKRYKSCTHPDGDCAQCSSCHYGLDCHSIPIGKPPRLVNSVGYPYIYADPQAMLRLTLSGDFPADELAELAEALKPSAPPTLAALRRRAGYTQATLADAMGVTQNTVSRWELGDMQPSPANLVRLRELLGEDVNRIK